MKDKIPKALREQVWITHMGKKFEAKCHVSWCNNRITVFDFQSGHNIPESKGGKTDISNLYPICSRCNLSMGDMYTIDEWVKLSRPLSKWNQFWQKYNCLKKCRSLDIKENGIKSSQNPMNQKDKHFKLRGILSAIQPLPKKKRIARGTSASRKT